jgi:hypothetical protein
MYDTVSRRFVDHQTVDMIMKHYPTMNLTDTLFCLPALWCFRVLQSVQMFIDHQIGYLDILKLNEACLPTRTLSAQFICAVS